MSACIGENAWSLIKNSTFHPRCCSDHRVLIRPIQLIESSQWTLPRFLRDAKNGSFDRFLLFILHGETQRQIKISQHKQKEKLKSKDLTDKGEKRPRTKKSRRSVSESKDESSELFSEGKGLAYEMNKELAAAFESTSISLPSHMLKELDISLDEKKRIRESLRPLRKILECYSRHIQGSYKSIFAVKEFVYFVEHIETQSPENKRKVALEAIKIYCQFFDAQYKRLAEKFCSSQKFNIWREKLDDDFKKLEYEKVKIRYELMNLWLKYRLPEYNGNPNLECIAKTI